MVPVKAFQQRHTQLLRIRVGVWPVLVIRWFNMVVRGLGMDGALDLCCAIGAHHSIGLDNLHIWQKTEGWEKLVKNKCMIHFGSCQF